MSQSCVRVCACLCMPPFTVLSCAQHFYRHRPFASSFIEKEKEPDVSISGYKLNSEVTDAWWAWRIFHTQPAFWEIIWLKSGSVFEDVGKMKKCRCRLWESWAPGHVTERFLMVTWSRCGGFCCSLSNLEASFNTLVYYFVNCFIKSNQLSVLMFNHINSTVYMHFESPGMMRNLFYTISFMPSVFWVTVYIFLSSKRNF